MESMARDNTPAGAALTPGEIKFAGVTNGTIAYQVFGAGEPLILCTGFATNMDLWSTIALELLQKKFMVIVFDYRGMGYSTNSGGSVTIGSLAEDLNKLLDVLAIQKTHHLGWSMGGYVAQTFAIHHPGKVNKLVLYATNCGGPKTVNPRQEIISILSNPQASPIDLLGTLFPDEWLACHPEPWKFLPGGTEPYSSETIELQYFAIQQWLDSNGGSAKLLNQLTMPVLVICGDQDKIVPCINSSILAELLRFSRLICIPESGHGLMYQLPETFADHVLSFLHA